MQNTAGMAVPLLEEFMTAFAAEDLLRHCQRYEKTTKQRAAMETCQVRTPMQDGGVDTNAIGPNHQPKWPRMT